MSVDTATRIVRMSLPPHLRPDHVVRYDDPATRDPLEAANCRSVDPELFFPNTGHPEMAAGAKAVCASCELRTPCLQYAQLKLIPHGIFGGLTPEERRIERRNT